VLSLSVVDNEYYGLGAGWSNLARAMLADGRLSAAEAAVVRWLDVFGQLIGNTDRHLGNFSFFSDGHRFAIAPVYDMLPMLFAPSHTQIVERVFSADPPNSGTLDVWHSAASAAASYWSTVVASSALSDEMRRMAETCAHTLEVTRRQFSFVQAPTGPIASRD
jgi:hypothetical protein